jgi:hypothetical protein
MCNSPINHSCIINYLFCLSSSFLMHWYIYFKEFCIFLKYLFLGCYFINSFIHLWNYVAQAGLEFLHPSASVSLVLVHAWPWRSNFHVFFICSFSLLEFLFFYVCNLDCIVIFSRLFFLWDFLCPLSYLYWCLPISGYLSSTVYVFIDLCQHFT